VSRYRLVLLCAALLAGLTPAAAAECKQDISALKAKISDHSSPPAAAGRESGQGHAEQGWYGHGIPRAKELLFNASRLADNGKDANCKQLVAEAQRTLGLSH
jgi:hypothetical protein